MTVAKPLNKVCSLGSKGQLVGVGIDLAPNRKRQQAIIRTDKSYFHKMSYVLMPSHLLSEITCNLWMVLLE